MVPVLCTTTLTTPRHDRCFDGMRNILLNRYRKNILRSFLFYFQEKHFNGSREWYKEKRKNWSKEALRDKSVACDVIRRTSNTTWWDWSLGSTLIFWRWPIRFQKKARDGVPLYVQHDLLLRYMKQPKWPSDELQREKLLSKLSKVRNRNYIEQGFVKSLTGYFAVPKAETDIRVVYDATKCGLNDALWAPNFVCLL